MTVILALFLVVLYHVINESAQTASKKSGLNILLNFSPNYSYIFNHPKDTHVTDDRNDAIEGVSENEDMLGERKDFSSHWSNFILFSSLGTEINNDMVQLRSCRR